MLVFMVSLPSFASLYMKFTNDCNLSIIKAAILILFSIGKPYESQNKAALATWLFKWPNPSWLLGFVKGAHLYKAYAISHVRSPR